MEVIRRIMTPTRRWLERRLEIEMKRGKFKKRIKLAWALIKLISIHALNNLVRNRVSEPVGLSVLTVTHKNRWKAFGL